MVGAWVDIDLNGRTALVTGSTQGIGHAIATGLARAGAEVVVNGRDAARVDAAVARIREAVPGARLRGIAADVADEAGAAGLVAELPEVDVLVNNLGIFGAAPCWRSTTRSGVATSRSTCWPGSGSPGPTCPG